MNNDLISRSALLEVFDGDKLLLESIVRHCIENAPAVDEMPKWISVEERLPNIGDRVLVVDDFGVVSTGRWGTFGFDKGITIDGCSRFGCIPTVKYWMPMPEPPKENEGGNDGKERTAAEGMAEEGPGSDRG